MRADEILIIDGKQKFEALNAGKHASGAILIGENHIADTMKCVHCGHQWVPIKGSGITRGWCKHCNGVTCGNPECDVCYPFEKKLEDYEKGKLKTLK